MNFPTLPHKWVSFVLLLSLIGAIYLFVSFSSKVKKDFLWFNSSDQNTYLINAALDFNEGYPAGISTTHPGIGSSFTYSLGYKLLKLFGYTSISKSTDLTASKDPMALLPDVYKLGGDLSIIIVLLCAFLVASITYLLVDASWLFFTYAFITTLFSGGFLFHSTMLRNELTATYYFLLASACVGITFYKNKKDTIPIRSTILLIVAGFFFAFSFFTKTQIILSIVVLFLFVCYLLYLHPITLPSSLGTSSAILGGNVLCIAYLCATTTVATFNFWLAVFALFIITSGIVFLNHLSFKKSYKIVDFFSMTAALGTGFLTGMIYIFERGLQGNAGLIALTLKYTDLLNGEGGKYINLEFGGITERFLYFLQQYFLESALCLGFFALVWFFIKKKNLSIYLLAIVLLIGMCYFHSLRVMLSINLGRAVYKYMVFTDVFVVLLVMLFYKNNLKLVSSSSYKYLVHLLFWLFLTGSAVKKYHKVEKDVLWNFTTYAWGIHKEGMPNKDESTVTAILQRAYTGYHNGHDRVFLGDEIKRGQQKMPIPKWQFDRTHKQSLNSYLLALEKHFNLTPALKMAVSELENSVFDTKILLFNRGLPYQNLVNRITLQRKQAYKDIFDQHDYQLFLALIDKGQLTVPF